MSNLLTSSARRLSVLLATLALVTLGAVGLWAPTAAALGTGTGCMFNAPSGATVGGIDFGHVGWAYQVAGSSTWIFGATENGGGSAYVPPGGDNESWDTSGTESQMFAAFKNAGHFHAAGYYTQWRCHTIPNTAVGAANTAVGVQDGSGYFFPTNNCLTKSVAILNAYGEGLSWPGYFQAPNNYFDNLGNAGWGPTHSL
jgi:hypothetical protein